MKLKTLLALPMLAFAGCLSSAPQSPVNWLLEPEGLPPLASVSVNAPYDDSRLAVLRPDGSVAFDAYNVFAARPSVLLRNAVTGPRDAATLRIVKMALDARSEGRLEVLVQVTLSKGGSSVSGEARESARNGCYSEAYSRAISRAVREAAGALK